MKILIIMTALFVSNSILANKVKSVLCTCNATVGVIGLPEFNQKINIPVMLNADDGFYEASSTEIDIVTAYECLQQKTDVRKIIKLNSVNCKL